MLIADNSGDKGGNGGNHPPDPPPKPALQLVVADGSGTKGGTPGAPHPNTPKPNTHLAFMDASLPSGPRDSKPAQDIHVVIPQGVESAHIGQPSFQWMTPQDMPEKVQLVLTNYPGVRGSGRSRSSQLKQVMWTTSEGPSMKTPIRSNLHPLLWTSSESTDPLEPVLWRCDLSADGRCSDPAAIDLVLWQPKARPTVQHTGSALGSLLGTAKK